jgi:hypothetical protein
MQEDAGWGGTMSTMAKRQRSASGLSEGEQRALAAFLSGRLPAGQLHGELRRAREEALARAAAAPAAERPPALRAA